MIFFEPLRVVTELVWNCITGNKNEQVSPDKAADDSSSFSIEGFLGLPPLESLCSPARAFQSPAYFSPPTIKVCKSVPDLLIDSEADPTGFFRGGLELGLRIAFPAFPMPRVCTEIPLSRLEQQFRGMMESLLPALGGVPIVGDWLKEHGIIREVKLQRLPSNHHLVQELREHLKTHGALKEMRLRQLPSDHPSVLRLREHLENFAIDTRKAY